MPCELFTIFAFASFACVAAMGTDYDDDAADAAAAASEQTMGRHTAIIYRLQSRTYETNS